MSSLLQNYKKNYTSPHGGIPLTRLLSYQDFIKERYHTIRSYIPLLLNHFPEGLTCREISETSGIWVQSLTAPLKSLVTDGQIEIIGVRRSTLTNRLNLIYAPKTKNS